MGPNIFVQDGDYPDFVKQANALMVEGNIGIYICASGISMAANHTKGIMAVNDV